MKRKLIAILLLIALVFIIFFIFTSSSSESIKVGSSTRIDLPLNYSLQTYDEKETILTDGSNEIKITEDKNNKKTIEKLAEEYKEKYSKEYDINISSKQIEKNKVELATAKKKNTKSKSSINHYWYKKNNITYHIISNKNNEENAVKTIINSTTI